MYGIEGYYDGLGANTSVLTITKPLMIKFLNKEASRLIAEGKGLHSVNQQLAVYKAFLISFKKTLVSDCLKVIHALGSNSTVSLTKKRISHLTNTL